MVACAALCVLSTILYARKPAHTSYTVSLSTYSYFIPLGIQEQVWFVSGQDSTKRWDTYACFNLGSIFPRTTPACGIRYSRQTSALWRWEISLEHDQTNSVDFELQYSLAKDQIIRISWGTLTSETGVLQSRFYSLADQRILIQAQAFRMCAKYNIRLDSKWHLEIHFIRNTESSDYLIGLNRNFQLLGQRWCAQWVWQDTNHSIYGNLKWNGTRTFCTLHGIYTESLGWSTGLSLGFTLPSNTSFFRFKK